VHLIHREDLLIRTAFPTVKQISMTRPSLERGSLRECRPPHRANALCAYRIFSFVKGVQNFPALLENQLMSNKLANPHPLQVAKSPPLSAPRVKIKNSRRTWLV